MNFPALASYRLPQNGKNREINGRQAWTPFPISAALGMGVNVCMSLDE